MTIKTDNPAYVFGEVIKISGTVPDVKNIVMPPGGYIVYIDLLDPAGKIINSTQVKPNALDHTYSLSTRITIKQAAQGTYIAKAMYVDFSSEIKFELKFSSLPDLTWSPTRLVFMSVDERQIAVTPTAGQLFLVSKEARNNGTIPATAAVKFQLLDGKGTLVYDNWVATTWEAGSTINLAMAVLIETPGTYRFTATLDPTSEVQEANESNNISNGVITVSDKTIGTKVFFGKFRPSEAGTSNFEIVVQDKIFSIAIRGDGEGISSVALDQEQKSLSLDNDGTTGSIEVRIPKELLSGNFTVFSDDDPISFDKSETDTESKVILIKPEGSFKISIQSTNVIPEFPTAISISVLTLTLFIVCTVWNKVGKGLKWSWNLRD